ncbi:DsbA family protein [Geminicoccus roseus]|uniref:DsbA family protein n=1 Tax=Geminicoccus roseus TaxID=404900 RepID=UPI000686D4E5|nr:DsbA family protein [Geminicoccus roseus]
MKRTSIILAGALVASAVGWPAMAQQTPSGPVTSAPAAETDAFGERVRAYLLQHPEVIMEAVQIFQDRQQAAQEENVKSTIAARSDDIFHDPTSPVGGNPDGDVTLVEFFDYNCPYCRAVAPTMAELRAADPSLRLVYKEFPILGPDSEVAARAALAADRQGKYEDFHDRLMQGEDKVTADKVFEVAAQVGLDLPRLKQDMADAATDRAIEDTRALAVALGINGTPGFVIGDQIIPGAVERATLEGLIAEQRTKSENP